MRARALAGWMLVGSFFAVVHCAAQSPSNPEATNNPVATVPLPLQVLSFDGIVERVIAREKEEIKALGQYSPIIETYIQEGRPDKALGIVPKSDFYFLGQADFRRGVKVHTLLQSEKKGFWMWTYNPAGFLQMIFLDRGEFDKIHYRFKYVRRQFLGEVRCIVIDVEPVPKTRGARFVGRI